MNPSLLTSSQGQEAMVTNTSAGGLGSSAPRSGRNGIHARHIDDDVDFGVEDEILETVPTAPDADPQFPVDRVRAAAAGLGTRPVPMAAPEPVGNGRLRFIELMRESPRRIRFARRIRKHRGSVSGGRTNT